MEKPKSMSLMDYMIRKTSRQLEIDEKVVESVVRHQWRHAHNMTYSLQQIEITGIGYFYTSPSKLRKKLAKAEKGIISYTEKIAADPSKGEKYQPMIQSLEEKIAEFNKRLQDHEGGLERTGARRIQQSNGKGMDQGARGV